MKSPGAQIVNHAGRRRAPRGLTCLLWACGGVVSALVAGLVVSASVYAGWNTGLATARARATTTSVAYARQQCDLIPSDLAERAFSLAQRRFEDLARLPQTPDCVPRYAPMGTAAFLNAFSSPTTPPTSPPAPDARATATPSPTAPPAAATRAPGAESQTQFDLEALLAEAQAAMSRDDYPSAIDTLDAIISIDGGFQRESTRALILEALTAQALSLYRSGRLSEAIVMTDRAEDYGDIGELNHERFIAPALFLMASATRSPTQPKPCASSAACILNMACAIMSTDPSRPTCRKRSAITPWPLALGGDHCPAQAQFQAALDLNPPYSRINLADLTARRDQSALACQAQPGEAGAAPAGGSSPANATRAPVGHSG